MKLSKTIALIAAGVFWFAAAPIAMAVDDAATIRANTEAWFKAVNAGNVDAVAASYADDAVVMAPGKPSGFHRRTAPQQSAIADVLV